MKIKFIFCVLAHGFHLWFKEVLGVQHAKGQAKDQSREILSWHDTAGLAAPFAEDLYSLPQCGGEA